jgi:hypothetical protein
MDAQICYRWGSSCGHFRCVALTGLHDVAKRTLRLSTALMSVNS